MHYKSWNNIGRVISGTIGYGVFLAVVVHFLSHPQPYDTADLIRAALGMVGLQVGIGKSPTEMVTSIAGVVAAFRSGKTKTVEHPVTTPEPIQTPPKKIKRIYKRKKAKPN